MTWSVFCLYALDTYDDSTFNEIKERVEKQMVEWRGFSRFREFNDRLIELYTASDTPDIVSLYPQILEWCKTM